MAIIDPELIVAIADDDNKTTSTVMCRVPMGLDKRGQPQFRLEKQTVPRKEGDALAKILLKKDKDADNLRQGLKPGPSKKLLSV